MNKNFINYILILGIGFLLGWLFFNPTLNDKNTETQHSNHETTWTCSMHPEIQKKEAGNCPLCGMALIPQNTSKTNGLSKNQYKMTKEAVALAEIQTIILKKEHTQTEDIEVSGMVEMNEQNNVVQVSHFSGRIESLAVRFVGEKVKKGQLLGEIYSPELVETQQELITLAPLKEKERTLYNAVRKKLSIWELTEQQINTIEQSQKVVTFFPIYSDLEGTVTKLLVQQGDHVQSGQALFRLNKLNSVWAIFDVFESEISEVKLGQIIEVKTNAYKDKLFKGKISFIDPVMDAKTRKIKVRVQLTNHSSILKPGMFVQGSIKKKTSFAGIVLPSSAVLWTGKKSLVYVKTNSEEPIFEMREIEIKKIIGNKYYVKNGLDIGEEVVIYGSFTIDAAAQLSGKNSMMNAKNSAKKTILQHQAMNNTSHPEIQQLIKHYFNLKRMLMRDQIKNIQNEAQLTIAIYKNFTNKSGKNWTSHQKDLEEDLKRLKEAVTIEQQRTLFKLYSQNLIDLLQAMGLASQYTVQFCPMAENNEGAYWLSEDKEINNPYFGGKMLKCGKIIKDTTRM